MTIIPAKRLVKRAAAWTSVALRPLAAPPQPSACILVYHRVSRSRVFDPWYDDWNVTPGALDRQVAALAASAELVFLRELRDRLARQLPGAPPLVCLTFDDGYRNFHDEVLPILRRHRAKATAFIATGYVGSDRPLPFDRWGTRHADRAAPAAWQPMGWREIDRCVDSQLVEVGGHSHLHVNAASADSALLCEEAARSREILLRRLGEAHAVSYAYPYGSRRLGQVNAAYVEAVKASGYRLAVSTNPGLVDLRSDPYELPRVEVYRTDGPAAVRAKVAGSLAPYLVTDRLRRSRRDSDVDIPAHARAAHPAR